MGELEKGGHEGTLTLQQPAAASDRSVGGVQVGLTYSVAPAAQQVVGQRVVRLQLNGFIQMILEGRRGAGVEGFR